jgi:hypothetical protein
MSGHFNCGKTRISLREGCIVAREVFVHARHTSANITPTVAGAVLLCLCSQVRGQGGAQTQTFIIHGTPKTCTTITQLDSALLTDSQQFFAGWTESDYVDAVAWSQACANYGWQIPWRPRIPLLQAQHDRALRSAQSQTVSSAPTAGALPSPVAQAAIVPPVEVSPSAAAGSALPSPPVQAVVAAPAQVVPSAAAVVPNPVAVQAIVAPRAQAVPSATTGTVLPSDPVQAAVSVPNQTEVSAATGSALPGPAVQAAIAAPVQAVSIAATGSVPPSAPVQAAIAAPAQAVPSAATGGVLPSAPVQAAVAAPAQAVPRATTDSVLPSAPVQGAIAAQAQTLQSAAMQAAVAAPAQAVPSAATGSALPKAHVRDHIVSDGEEDSLLSDNYYKEHFHQESLWVANKANLDIGDDRGPSSWSSNGIPAQMKNRLTADRIVLYCWRKTNSGESGKRPLLWDLRWCEAEEASAYNRLVSGNEFPTAGRAIVLGCAGVDSYIYLERCMATLTEAGMH